MNRRVYQIATDQRAGQEPPVVGRLPSAGGPSDPSDRPRRLHRLHRVWPDRDGNISYLITLCVDGRARVLDNKIVFERFISFLLDSPRRYDWFPRRFVVMPDHLHLIAHQGREAVRLGQWIKAMKAVVGGLERRENKETNALAGDAGSGDPAYRGPIMSGAVGRLPSAGGDSSATGEKSVESGSAGSGDPAYNEGKNHPFTREKRSWHWQEGFHDHKFRTPESEQRKWEYICLNPVRYGLVERPEQWPFGGEIFHGDRPQIIRGTPPLLEAGILIEEKDEM